MWQLISLTRIHGSVRSRNAAVRQAVRPVPGASPRTTLSAPTRYWTPLVRRITTLGHAITYEVRGPAPATGWARPVMVASAARQRAGLGDQQAKTTRSFPVTRWLDQDANVPARDTQALAALAEAVAVVAYGRSAQGCAGLVAAITAEPTMRAAWLRSLVTELRRPSPTAPQPG